MPFNYEMIQIKDDQSICIKQVFFMKMLLKITSKKINPNILSFYYKLPNL